MISVDTARNYDSHSQDTYDIDKQHIYETAMK